MAGIESDPPAVDEERDRAVDEAEIDRVQEQPRFGAPTAAAASAGHVAAIRSAPTTPPNAIVISSKSVALTPASPRRTARTKVRSVTTVCTTSFVTRACPVPETGAV